MLSPGGSLASQLSGSLNGHTGNGAIPAGLAPVRAPSAAVSTKAAPGGDTPQSAQSGEIKVLHAYCLNDNGASRSSGVQCHHCP